MNARRTAEPAEEGNAGGSRTDDTTRGDARAISKDDAFHVLQNARRRAVLRYMLEHDDTDTFHMREVTEEVAAWEHDTTLRELTSDQRQRIYIALYQSHLPKLDDYGVIDYDQNRGTIEPTPLLRVFAPYLADGLHASEDVLAAPDDESTGGLSASVTSFFDR